MAFLSNRWARAMLIAGLGMFIHALALSSGALASKPVNGEWFVVLDPPPTLGYQGHATSMKSSHARLMATPPPAAGTAPEVTGQRLDVWDADVQAYVEYLDGYRQAVTHDLRQALGRPVTHKRVFHHVLNGFVTRLGADEVQKVKNTPGVQAVVPNWAHQRQMDRGPQFIGADVLWSPSAQTAFPPSLGQGIVIGVLDSGINWDHEMFQDSPPFTESTFTNPYDTPLGECSRAEVPCNDKLVGVYDFAAEGTFGKDPDADGHGTHVASIAAGNPFETSLASLGGQTVSLSGVAPEAQIISYKVCYKNHPDDESLDDQCTGDAIVDGLEQALADQVDVINYSLGSDAADPWIELVRYAFLWRDDVAFVTSAGNSGPGAGTMGSPGNAPWTMAVGNSTHDRTVGLLVDVATITNIAAVPGDGPSVGSDITSPARRVDNISDDLKACDALPADSLTGEIAVIERGGCFFSVKIKNAEEAGAVAVLMVNNVAGPPIPMATGGETTIPAVMIGRSVGQQVLSALASGPQSATIEAGNQAVIDEAFADQMASSSSRGPNVKAAGTMKPNVVAPGSAILGAFVPDADSVNFLTGTSMASPHVAGAAALLRAIHPDWGVDAVFSALQTTAVIESITSGDQPATIHDRGAGRIRVDRAARVGLYLPLQVSEFQAADPDTGGDPTELNLPGLINQGCGEVCTFTRTLKAHRDGEWTVSVEGSADVTVAPQSFSLSAGQSQDLTVTARPDPDLLGALEEVRVVLTEAPPPAGAINVTQPVKQALTVAMSNDLVLLPGLIEHPTAASRGQFEVNIQAITGLARAEYVVDGLAEITEKSVSLPVDPSNREPYSSDGVGTETYLVDVPANAGVLFAETTFSEADDIDLYVGFDANGDGVADEDEEVCQSTSPDELERCQIETPEAGQWWILVQNWADSSLGASDEVRLRYGVSSPTDPTESLTVFAAGPGTHVGGPLDVTIYFDDATLMPDEPRLSSLRIYDNPTGDRGEVSDDDLVGVVPLVVERSGVGQPELTVLFPNETHRLSVAGETVHDKVVVDVPPTATQLDVDVASDEALSVSLRRLDFEDLPAHAPNTPPAPSDEVASGEAGSAGLTLSVDQPKPGRYYVVLDNDSSANRRVEITPTLTESGRVADVRYALYSPVDRNTNQGVEFQTSGQPFAVWYSFDDAGLPIFYLGSQALDGDSSVWVSPLDRYTRGNDKQIANPAGRMALTHIDRDRAVFSWHLNGAHGSDLVSAEIIPEACVDEGGAAKSYTGHWFSPGRDQGGSTTIMAPGIQIQVRYYFDALGVGRWVQLAADGAGPEADTLVAKEYRGNCPNCDHDSAPTVTDVGVYSRTYTSESKGTETLVFESPAPLNQTFFTPSQLPIEKLSERLSCP
ncbi:MAG: S8 family serine peptidase [Wenzhouxiangella sp.]|nr:S8 family serine peptidase [Wenzhouxiangella sp.]